MKNLICPHLKLQTGTLTEEGLDLWGAVPSLCETRQVDSERKEEFATFQSPVREVGKLSPGPLLVGMSACHSLTLIDESLIGDPLDLKVCSVLFSKWIKIGLIVHCSALLDTDV